MTFYKEIIEALDQLAESGVYSADEVEVRVSPSRYRHLEHELDKMRGGRSSHDGISIVWGLGISSVVVDSSMDGPAWTISRRMRHHVEDERGKDIESPPEPEPELVEPGFLDELKGL